MLLLILGPTVACAQEGIDDFGSYEKMEDNGWDLNAIDTETRLVFQRESCQKKFDFANGCEILAYMLKIDPRHWSVFANRDDISDDSWRPDYQSTLKQYLLSAKSFTKEALDSMTDEKIYYRSLNRRGKFKMQGISRNNVAESTTALKASGWFIAKSARTFLFNSIPFA